MYPEKTIICNGEISGHKLTVHNDNVPLAKKASQELWAEIIDLGKLILISVSFVTL